MRQVALAVAVSPLVYEGGVFNGCDVADYLNCFP
jgi:hypothetical protein